MPDDMLDGLMWLYENTDGFSLKFNQHKPNRNSAETELRFIGLLDEISTDILEAVNREDKMVVASCHYKSGFYIQAHCDPLFAINSLLLDVRTQRKQT
ncbi:MAG: hypothetical protein OXE50_15475 [Chloroflexi bacterium]|nr:hypothetical protein [Chloroflexota bacterium]